MNKKWTLKRTIQCDNCPFKKTANLNAIKHYDIEQHKALFDTIAKDLDWSLHTPIKAMACHHSTEGYYEHCVGWLNHQLGIGNNIPLRLKMMYCENAKDIQVIGEQHQRFEDTLPK